MRDVVEVLQEHKVFYLATSENNVPHVRPFGAVAAYDGRVWFCTSDQKAVCEQIRKNPQVEIASTGFGAEVKWLRLTGKAVIEDNAGAKAAIFKVMPQLKVMYAGKMDHFTVFYLAEAKAVLSSTDGSKAEELTIE